MGNKKKKSGKAKSGYKCELCDDRDKAKPVVACDVCDKWHHFSCVNLVSISKKDPWICNKCTEPKVKEPNAKKATDPTPIQSCELCRHIDNDEMILCDTCQRKYHYVCVELDLTQLPDPFICHQCRPIHSVTSKGNVMSTPVGTGTFNRVRSTNRSNDFLSISRPETIQRSHDSQTYDDRVQLQLEYIEEQRKFQERWDRREEIREQEYLQQRYNALLGEIDSSKEQRRFRSSCNTEKWIASINQGELDRELMKVDEPVQSFDMSDFTRRLEKLKFNDTSPLKPRKPETAKKFPMCATPTLPTCPEQPIKLPTQTKFDSPIHHNSRTFEEPADRTKVPTPDTTFGLPKDCNDEKLQQNDPSNQSNFRHQANAQVPNADFQLTTNEQQMKTLTKAQIASRQVVKYALHHFYGDPLEWISWYSSYNSTTEMCGYTNAENLHRLKESLKGSAEAAVKHRFLSPTEVPNIIKTLKMLFGRSELIVNALLTKVKDIPAPKADKLETLVDYAMEVNSISVTIESANISFHMSNPNLIHELVEKLPIHTKIDWAKFKATQTNITLKVLADWLYSLAEVVCTVTVPSSTKPAAKFDKRSKASERLNVHQLDDEQAKKSNRSSDHYVSQTISSQQDRCKVCKGKCKEISKCGTFKSYDIKQKWNVINNNKLCRKCLKAHNGYCKETKECGVNGCVFKHHPMLHSERKSQRAESPNRPNPEENSNGTKMAVVTNNFHNTSVPNIIFRIVPVTLYNGNIAVSSYAYLDEGSSGTLMEEDLAKELQLNGFPERLCLLWTNNVHRIEAQSHRMNVFISGQNEFSARYEMKGVRTVKDLGLPAQTINQKELVKRFPYLNGIPLISYANAMPQILIGLPHARLCTQLTSIEGSECQPIASKSRIGWSLHGPTREMTESYVDCVNTHRFTVCEKRRHENDVELHRLVKDHFSLENFGVNINTEFNLNSRENQRALDILNNSTRRVNERFETALLWRYDDFELNDSFAMAKRRLICLEKSKKNYVQTIDATINDYIAKGYVTKLTPEDLSIERSRVGYLPIFIVVHPKKPEKLRMVFDAAAKTNGISLNDMLLKGPDQLNSLIDILRRFRENIIAICGDIFEMYHQIKICEEDKHVQRFLWRNGNTDKEPDVYVLNVMTFGAKCSPSSAQFIKNRNAEEFREVLPKAVDAIVSNTYVDDMMDGGESDDKVIQLVNEVQKIHNHGGFKIGKFLSNSTKVMEVLGEKKNSQRKQLDMDPIQHLERVLGMFWNTTTDCFMFSLKYAKVNEDVISGKRYPTKREILQTLMSIFDPLGLLQHFLVRLKILLQKIWRSELKWDDQLVSDDHKEMWDSWFRILPEVEKIEIPRLYSPNLSSSTVDLHIFVDASEEAYAAVAFLRIVHQQQVNCLLVGSKSRVAPIKYVSIPRLELQAGVLGTRFMKSIEQSQKFQVESSNYLERFQYRYQLVTFGSQEIPAIRRTQNRRNFRRFRPRNVALATRKNQCS